MSASSDMQQCEMPCGVIKLTSTQFDEFNQLCQTTVPLSNKVKAAAKALDEEGFSFNLIGT